MRQFIYATMTMLVGIMLATLAGFGLAHLWRSFNTLWLTPLVFLPALGVAEGCWLAHRSSQGQDPWPITHWGKRTLLVLLGALGSLVATYLVYLALSSVWFEANFTEMALTPSAIRAFSETNRYGTHSSDLTVQLILGLLAGTYGTFRFIREEWFQ